MGLLLYKSDEMFSATQLIRQSKMIFDKVVNNEIEKAIILRDGKPGFLLMDFEKYEKIMADYEKLKAKVAKQKKAQQKKESTPPVETPPKIEEKLPVEPVKETIVEEKENNTETEDESIEDTEQTVEEEINEAMKSIDAMNFSDKMKDMAKEKIKAKILRAREERAKLLAEQKEHENERLKEELELQAQIKEKTKKKEQELEEFWD